MKKIFFLTLILFKVSCQDPTNLPKKFIYKNTQEENTFKGFSKLEKIKNHLKFMLHEISHTHIKTDVDLPSTTSMWRADMKQDLEKCLLILNQEDEYKIFELVDVISSIKNQLKKLFVIGRRPRCVFSPLAYYLSFFAIDIKNLINNNASGIDMKEMGRFRKKQLEWIQSLFLNFNPELVSEIENTNNSLKIIKKGSNDSVEGTNNSPYTIIFTFDFFRNSDFDSERLAKFYRWSALFFEDFIKDIIEVYDLISKGNLMESKSKLSKIENDYKMRFQSDELSWFFSRIKINQYYLLLYEIEQFYLEKIRSWICSENMTKEAGGVKMKILESKWLHISQGIRLKTLEERKKTMSFFSFIET